MFGKIFLDMGGREMKYIKGMLCAKHSSRGFIFIISFYPSSSPMMEILFFSPPFYRKGMEAQRG